MFTERWQLRTNFFNHYNVFVRNTSWQPKQRKFVPTGYFWLIQQTVSHSLLFSLVIKHFGDAVFRPFTCWSRPGIDAATNYATCLQLVFHDDGPFLLVTQSSFDDLSRRLVERDVTDHVTLEHFRPTITISGQSPPFDEVSAVESCQTIAQK